MHAHAFFKPMFIGARVISAQENNHIAKILSLLRTGQLASQKTHFLATRSYVAARCPVHSLED